MSFQPVVSIVQGPHAISAISNTFTSAVTRGNLLVCGLQNGTPRAVIGDNLGSYWQLAVRRTVESINGVDIWYAIAAASGSCTVTFAASVTMSAVWEVQGANTLDQIEGDGSASSSAWDCGPIATVTSPVEFMLYFISAPSNAPSAPASGNWTQTTLGGGTTYSGTSLPTTQWSSIVNGTLAGATKWTAILATFKWSNPHVLIRSHFRPLAV